MINCKVWPHTKFYHVGNNCMLDFEPRFRDVLFCGLGSPDQVSRLRRCEIEWHLRTELEKNRGHCRERRIKAVQGKLSALFVLPSATI